MNKSIIRVGSFILAAGLMLMPLHSANAFPATQKKLIEAGWERPDASDLLKHQKQIEKSPYDGIVLMLIGKDDAGKGVSLQNRVFEPTSLKLKWFAEDIKELKSFHSTKLTDNFIRVSTSRNTPDWFDDAAWKKVIDNWKIAATIAKEGNLKGICFDPEMYSGAALFTYSAQKNAQKYSFNQYRDKVRQRGREIIQAVSSIYPDMVFFTFRMNDINRRHASNIQTSRYNLYPALINGWLDVAPPEMTFVDGGESAYTYDTPDEFLKTANWIRNTGLQLVAPENRRKYRAQVQVSFGLYLDAYSYYKLNSSDSRDRRYALQPLDGSRLNRLQSNVNAAVDAADEYVWTWGEHYRWWPTKTKNVNPQTWEEILPGTTKVLLQAVHPELAAAAQQAKFDQLIQEKKVTNLLTNSDFSDTADNTAKPALDWQTQNAPIGWSTWQKKVTSQPPGTFGIDPKGDENGGNAVSLAGMYQGFFIQQIPVKPGEEYYARVRVRQSGDGMPRLDIRWQNESGWADSQQFQVTSQSTNGKWITLSLPATVPTGVSKIVVLVGVDGQTHKDDIVWFDNVQLYKMPS